MNFFSYFKRKSEPIQINNTDIDSFEFIDIHEPSPTNKEPSPTNNELNPTKQTSEKNQESITIDDMIIPDPYLISPPLRHRIFIQQPAEYESFPTSDYNSFSPKNSEEFTDMDMAIQSIINLILGKDVVERIVAHHNRTYMGIL